MEIDWSFGIIQLNCYLFWPCVGVIKGHCHLEQVIFQEYDNLL